MPPDHNTHSPTSQCNMPLDRNAHSPTSQCNMPLDRNAHSPTSQCNMPPDHNTHSPTSQCNMPPDHNLCSHATQCNILPDKFLTIPLHTVTYHQMKSSQYHCTLYRPTRPKPPASLLSFLSICIRFCFCMPANQLKLFCLFCGSYLGVGDVVLFVRRNRLFFVPNT